MPGIWLPATGVGIMLLLSLSRLLDQTWGAKTIRYIGRNTLPIYVMHISLLLVAREATRDWLMPGYVGALALWTFGAAILVGVCLGLSRLFKRGGLGWLFSQPEMLKIGAKPTLASI